MKFAHGSVVWITACSSASDLTFVYAFIDQGASAYLGWSSDLSLPTVPWHAPYFVDRMLGANAHPRKESPPQRAFPLLEVLADMDKKGLTTDLYHPQNRLEVYQALVPNQPQPIFAPSIKWMRVNEWDGELTLEGYFGSDKPKVTIGGNARNVKTWNAEKLVVDLPLSGPGSFGDVIVEVRNIKSNTRQLTQWTIPVSYSWQLPVDLQGFAIEGPGTIRYRADVAGYRTIPGEALRFDARGGPPTRDSLLHLVARGFHEDDDCTTRLTGTADYVSPPAYTGTGALLNSFFSIATDTRQVRLGFALGALPTSPHELILFGRDCTGTYPFAAFAGQLDGNDTVLRDQTETPGTVTLPVVRFSLLPDYSIPFTHKFEDIGGGINVSWPTVMAETPPRDTDDSGK